MFNNVFREAENVNERRKRQIDTLKIFNDGVTELVKDVEYQVEFQSGGRPTLLSVSLSPDFPAEKPLLKVSPVVQHPWVASTGEIVSAPGLLNFTVYSDLGRVVQAIVREFELRPPPLLLEGGAASTPTIGYIPSTSSYPPLQYHPPISVAFPQLNSLSTAELQQLNDNPQKLDLLIETLPMKQALVRSIDEWITATENLAKSNLEREPELVKVREEVMARAKELEEARSRFEHLSAEYQALSAKFTPQSIKDALQHSVTAVDEESERVAERFLNGEMELDAFLLEYTNHRKVSHARRVKHDKLSHQLHQLHQAGF